MIEGKVIYKHIGENHLRTNFLRRKTFLPWLVLILFYSLGNAIGERGTVMQDLHLNEPIIERWLAIALTIPRDQLVKFDQKLFFRPMLEAKGVLGVFLKESVDPYRAINNVGWVAYISKPGGIDLLRCEYNTAGMNFTLTQSRNFVILEVSAPNLALSHKLSKADYLKFLVQTVVKTQTADHDWKFEIPSIIGNEPQPKLISNLGAPSIKDLQSRHDRADILLINDSVFFIFYNKIEQLEEFLPADQWFNK